MRKRRWSKASLELAGELPEADESGDEYEELPPDEEYEEEAPQLPDEVVQPMASEPQGNIEWTPQGDQGEGELVVTVPPSPRKGIAETRLVARGSKRAASRSVASQASKLLSSSAVQAVLPPQAKVALKAAQGLAKLVPSSWKKAGVKAAKSVAKNAAKSVAKKLKFW